MLLDALRHRVAMATFREHRLRDAVTYSPEIVVCSVKMLDLEENPFRLGDIADSVDIHRSEPNLWADRFRMNGIVRYLVSKKANLTKLFIKVSQILNILLSMR